MATINEKVATHAENKRAEAEQAKAAGNLAKALSEAPTPY